jgi:predicted Zn-dependent protease
MKTTPARTALLVLLGLALALPACTTNPATGRRQLDYLSREDEIALGTEVAQQLTQEYGGAVTDPAVNRYITGIGMSMVRHTESDYPTLPWEFTLLNSEVINAFALPGGKVFISRGLAERFRNEAELAAVIGHEIGHVTAEHADRGIQNQLPVLGVAVVGGILAGNDQMMQAAVGVLVSATGTFALKYNREQEDEADKLGMRYMVAAGYNPAGMLGVMRTLSEASKGQNPPEWQSTHPLPETRIANTQRRLDGRYRDIVNDPNYGTFEARFQREFLDRMRTIPYPAKRTEGGPDLSDPASWCLHCARRGDLALAR